MTQTAVVTGGSTGVGAEIATALSKRGLRVITCGSRPGGPAR